MDKYFIVKGKRFVAIVETRRGGDVLHKVYYTRDPGDALLCNADEANEIATFCKGEVKPHNEILQYR